MRTLKSFLFGLALLFGSTALAQKTVQTAVIKTNIACDHCKACESCGDKFYKTLLREKGVQMVSLDEKTMILKVTYNSKKTDAATIEKAVTLLGYDANELKADPEAYAALDGCCKK